MDGRSPPVLPPKPSSHEASRMGTPVASLSPRSTPGPDQSFAAGSGAGPVRIEDIPDPGDQWLPKVLQDKSIQDLADILASPELLNALTHSSAAAHPSLRASHRGLEAALAENVNMAGHLLDQEARLARLRSSTQAQLLSTHALERQWRQKQSDMDDALAPFSPASLYQRLGQGVQEQALVCQALEESFLDGDAEGGMATEREVLDWVRRYKDAKSLYYLRRERKERWDEGRVGGWR